MYTDTGVGGKFQGTQTSASDPGHDVDPLLPSHNAVLWLRHLEGKLLNHKVTHSYTLSMTVVCNMPTLNINVLFLMTLSLSPFSVFSSFSCTALDM